jgi:HCOMODA/2-hydroxy-3-carboxy-muconic semialdehyde decarboxylase
MTQATADPGGIGRDLALANRILANEGVLDGFGHVSARHPDDPGRFLLSRSRSPGLVDEGDIREFDLDARPLREDGAHHYAERVIHACAYRARPDVRAVCHLHAAPVLPFACTGIPLVPVVHVGALIGHEVPLWDSRDEFGDTDLLVSTLDQGRSLARALGSGWVVLMRRHGAVVAGRSLREAVFRAIALKLNAEAQLQAQAIGRTSPLTAAEVDLSAEANLRQGVLGRLWEYWCSRLRDAPAAPWPATDGPVPAEVLP